MSSPDTRTKGQVRADRRHDEDTLATQRQLNTVAQLCRQLGHGVLTLTMLRRAYEQAGELVPTGAGIVRLRQRDASLLIDMLRDEEGQKALQAAAIEEAGVKRGDPCHYCVFGCDECEDGFIP